ncbi:ABC transporter permease [Entomobacter blattae]|uniref:ABC-2 type transporter domain-containing protein n=1 Tax=Entomobacter blattae TaxID=2762277 RepID=A0A7H1NQZ9_9PROT|nr:hypothetical protein [Entomobacter blattae]QNT78209.1 hypothetical protein JGUZn3_09780 [Entomobacter blattae]
MQASFSVDAFFLCLFLGTLGARYRDVSPMIASILPILFFMTPMIWKPDLIYLGRQYMLLNPFFPLIEIMRAPLMGEIPRLSIWVFAIGYSVIIWLAGFFVLTKVRARPVSLRAAFRISEERGALTGQVEHPLQRNKPFLESLL